MENDVRAFDERRTGLVVHTSIGAGIGVKSGSGLHSKLLRRADEGALPDIAGCDIKAWHADRWEALDESDGIDASFDLPRCVEE